MCGISGIINGISHDIRKIGEMLDVQKHRGPDGKGILFGNPDHCTLSPDIIDWVPSWAIGHLRLSILDTSANGSQPMSYLNGMLWIVFNGEIYNYLELKTDLINKGYVFNNNSDTEVILASYQEWGVDCFERFIGMWAMAIVDRRSNKLIFSRDRFGEKPLHICMRDKTLFFSSEIKGITSVLGNNEVNKNIARDYLKWGIVNHTNETFFQDIKSFPPACYAVIDIQNPSLSNWETKKYWDITKITPKFDLSFEEASRRFHDTFLSSVKIRMRSDVPIGFCLSGGLDSSSIVSAAHFILDSEKISSRLHTFTSISDIPEFDESQWAEKVNKHVDARSTFVKPSEEEFIKDIDQLLWHQEEPFTTTSIYAQWKVMKAARESNVIVLLDGQGADEILCGYKKFYMFYIQNLLRKKKFYSPFKEISNILRKGDRGIFDLMQGVRYMPPFIRSFFESRYSIIKENFLRTSLDLSQSCSLLQRQINDLQHFSVPALLRYEDRNSMAWSVESRVPFLDHRLVELVLSLPVEFKLKEGYSKYIMRKSLVNIVPKEILSRRDKMGFSTPEKVWMNNKLGYHISQYLKSDISKLSKYIDHKALVNDIRIGKNLNLIFRLFLLDKWSQKFNIEIDSLGQD